MKSLAIRLAVAAACGIATASAAGIYIGDVAAQGQGVSAGPVGPDTSNGGRITYAFFDAADNYTNTSGGTQLLSVTETNFNAINPGNVFPFVAVLSGAGNLGASYNVVAAGDAIAGVAGLNNASFTVGGLSPTITLNNGETLVSGFYQDANMMGWESGGTGDYLSDVGGAGNGIPGGGTGALADDANWSTLAREYRFNVGLDVVPEPSVPIVLLPAAFVALISRRRRKA